MLTEKLQRAAAVMILSSSMLLVACGGEERQVVYLERAQEYFDQDNMDKAKIEVKNVLQINPNNADARYILGMISEKSKNFQGAFRQFSAAVEADESHIKSLNKLAEYYLFSKDVDNAQPKISKILEIEPENTDALANQAAIFASKENYEDAIKFAEKALSLDPGHVKANTVLTALHAKDNPDLALDIITTGIEKQPENESLKMLKVRLLVSQNKPDEVIRLLDELRNEYPDNKMYVIQLVNYRLKHDKGSEDEKKATAEKILRDAVKSSPEEEQYKIWLVEFLVNNRDADTGRKQLEQYLSDSPDSFSLRDQLAKIHLSNKDKIQAKSLYRTVVENEPDSAQSLLARNRLIAITLTEDDTSEVKELLQQIFDKDPENAEALITRAKLKLSEADIDGAIPDLRVVLKNNPESVTALFLLAKSHEAKKSIDLALDNYQRLLTIEPKNLDALIGAGRMLMSKKQVTGAMKLLEQAKEIGADNPELVRLLTGLYSGEQRWDDALSTAAKLTENADTMAMGHYLQGRIYLRKKDFKTAIQALEKSHKLEPKGVETLSALVGAYVAENQSDKAIDYVRSHSKKYPEQVHAQELLGNLYARNGDKKSAIKLFKSVIKQAPNRNSSYRSLARIYVSQGRLDDVEALYRKGVENNPKNTGLKLMLAELYQERNSFDKAVAEYEEILALNPNELVIKNNLAALLMDHFNTPENLPRISALASDLAVTENPAFLDTAGWVQYQLGNYPQALALLVAAHDKGGRGPVYHYHLGMAYLKSDQKGQAKEQLELALADNNEIFPGIDEAKAALGEL